MSWAAYSVQCNLCALWCHKDSTGMSDPFFKNLELKIKETEAAFWACRSCQNFAGTFGAKVNLKLKEVEERIDGLQERWRRTQRR
jgi:hypothetical protein